MSGRGGRARGGLVVPAAKQPASGGVKPPANNLAAATRVSGRSPARGAAAAGQQPAAAGQRLQADRRELDILRPCGAMGGARG